MRRKEGSKLEARSSKLVVSIALLAALVNVACASSPPTPSAPSSELRASSGERSEQYVLGPEDAVAITVAGHTDFTGVAVVRPDGRLSAPGLGEISAAGTTAPALEAAIRERLRRWIREPLVSVAVTQFRSPGQIFVLGQVTKAGPYPYRPGLTATEALALAGGPAVDADLKHATVLRAGAAEPDARVVLDLTPLAREGASAPRVPLRPGDMLVLPLARRPRVSVVGDVQKPGPYVVSEGARVLEAIQLAQGPRPSANLKGATLTRAGVVTPLDLEALLRRGATAQNLLLEDGDSILIPENRIRVYVLGEVARPDILYLPDGATLLDALAAAGGHTRDADLKQIRLGRKAARGETLSVQKLDLNRMVAREKPLPAPALQEGDLLFVPSRTRKKTVSDYLPFLYPVELLARMMQ
jgi:polysaccharide export outer membrane protein